MIREVALVFCALAVTGCTTSSSVTTSYYDISGSNERELDRSIREQGPMSGHAFAATQMQILPVNITPVETATGCKIGSASFRVKAKLILPRWKDRSNADQDLRNGFDNYADYAPTQILAELFKDCGYEAIVYKSQFGEQGFNVVLFNVDDAEVIDCTPFLVKGVEVKFENKGTVVIDE